ncbi:hypothetical protein B0H14DRAFT_2829412, partial [Mycena olivaceomarginata]
MNVAQAFDNMTFRSPNWGTERLPLPRSPRAASPSLSHMPQQQQQQKPQSPSDSGPSSQGRGCTSFLPHPSVEGSQMSMTSTALRSSNLTPTDPAPAQSHASGHRRTGSNASAHSNGGVNNSPFLFPSNMLPRPRSGSDHALEPPNNFIEQMSNIGSALDDSMGDVILPPQGHEHRRYDSGGDSLPPPISFGGVGGGYAQAQAAESTGAGWGRKGASQTRRGGGMCGEVGARIFAARNRARGRSDTSSSSRL